jgi:hypothetical protein
LFAPASVFLKILTRCQFKCKQLQKNEGASGCPQQHGMKGQRPQFYCYVHHCRSLVTCLSVMPCSTLQPQNSFIPNVCVDVRRHTITKAAALGIATAPTPAPGVPAELPAKVADACSDCQYKHLRLFSHIVPEFATSNSKVSKGGLCCENVDQTSSPTRRVGIVSIVDALCRRLSRPRLVTSGMRT